MNKNTKVALAGLAAAAAGGAVLASRRTTVVAEVLSRDALLHLPDIEPRIVPVTSKDGAALHVREYGDPDAAPIVFSHGWTCSADYWSPQVNAFAGTHRVITYDQRGHGSSEVGTRPLGADVLADDLAAVLAATVRPDAKAVVAGHSMGGMSIMAWAGDYPEQVRDRVKAIMLASTATDSLLRETTVVPIPPRFPRLPDKVASGILSSPLPLPQTPLSASVIKYVALGKNASAAEVDFCAKIIRDCHPRARGLWGAALSALDIREALDNIDVPTTVVVGTADRLTPPVHSRALAGSLERAGVLDRLVEMPGVGHMTSVEDIDTFDAEILRMVTENS